MASHPAVVRTAMLVSLTHDKTGLHSGISGGPDPESADAPGRDLQIVSRSGNEMCQAAVTSSQSALEEHLNLPVVA